MTFYRSLRDIGLGICLVGIIIYFANSFSTTGETQGNTNVHLSTPIVVNYENNVGIVSPGIVVRSSFVIHNSEKAPMRFNKFIASCGSCVRPVGWPNIIEGGRSATVVIELNTTGKKGLVRERVVGIVDDSEQRAVSRTIEGIVKGVWVEPATIEYGNIKASALHERTVTVMCAGYPRGDVQEMKVSSKDLMLRNNAIDGVDGDIRQIGQFVIAWTPAPAILGRRTEYVQVDTNISQVGTLQIPIHGYITGSMHATPSQIVFGALEVGKRKRARVELSGDAETAVQDLSIVTDDSRITCNLEVGIDKGTSIVIV